MRIFFDLDGTLIDIKKRFYLVYSDILKKNNKKCLNFKDYIKLRKNHISTKDIILKTCDFEFYKYFIKERNKFIESEKYLEYDSVFSGVISIMNKLFPKHDLILITLRDNKKNTIKQLEAMQLHKYFEMILIGEHFGTWETKYKLIKNYDKSILKSDSLIVGDTEVDILAGKNLGIKTCGVLCGMRTYKLLKQLKPDYLIRDLRGLTTILDDLI